MKIEQIYTGCLAQGAYYLVSDGEAAIIDPLRDVETYIKKAAIDNAKIKYVFETHFHADFVSGHVTLAEKTGAPIIYGPQADPSFEAYIAKDEETFKLGKLTIKVLHTPGHTMESTTYLLLDEAGREHAIFTGDTLFLGDVGRPDLAQKTDGLSTEDLAGYAYDSLRNKIMPLPDHVIVYPAHGAGSACGKNMMKETIDTLGNQKKVNYALQTDLTKADFIKELITDLAPPPGYFPLNVKLNKEGYDNLDKVMSKGLEPLSPMVFETIANELGAVMLDVRTPFDFATAHIPNSIFIGLDGDFAPWVGQLLVDTQLPIILVVEEGREEEAVTRLSRVGFDRTMGYLSGGIDAWEEAGKEIDTVNSTSALDLAKNYDSIKATIFDVRKTGEHQSSHILDSSNIPLSQINELLSSFPKKDSFYLHCAGGYRSMIAASILKSRGYHQVINVTGGYKAIDETEIPKSEYICPSTLTS